MVHGSLVTAASSGIGAEFARQLGEIGLNVAIVAWRRPRLEELAHELEAKNRVRVKIIQPTCLNRIFYRSSFGNPSRRNRTPRKQCWIWLGERFLRPRTRKGIGFAGCQLSRAFSFSHVFGRQMRSGSEAESSLCLP